MTPRESGYPRVVSAPPRDWLSMPPSFREVDIGEADRDVGAVSADPLVLQELSLAMACRVKITSGGACPR